MIFLRRSFFFSLEMPDSSVSNFVLHTTYEMSDSCSEGFNSVKKPIVEILLQKKNWYMQNNLKTGMHMHSDPQMRICLKVSWSIVTFTWFSTTNAWEVHQLFLCSFLQSHMKHVIYHPLSFKLVELGLLSCNSKQFTHIAAIKINENSLLEEKKKQLDIDICFLHATMRLFLVSFFCTKVVFK